MNKNVRAWAYSLPAIISITALLGVLVMSYLLVTPCKPVYIVNNPKNHFAYVKNGSIFVHREFCITDDTKLVTINRDLIHIGKDLTLRVTLDTTSHKYSKGCQIIDRILDIPDGTPPGEYQMDSIATWQSNVLKVDSVRLPILSVTIAPKAK